MTFRHISVLADAVVRKAELRAARQATAAKGGGLTGEEKSISPPIASTAGGQTGGNGMGKRPSNGGDRARPVQEGNNVMQSGGTALNRNRTTNAHRMVYVLPFDRCERIANPRPGAMSPVAAMRSHLLKEWNAVHETGP
jgi:hypothetical protein